MSHSSRSTSTSSSTKSTKDNIQSAQQTTEAPAAIRNSLSIAHPDLEETYTRKRRRKRKIPQSYLVDTSSATEDCDSNDSHPMSCSDVERFQGKIVYNLDGSAYIIDPENDSILSVEDNQMSVGSLSTENATLVGTSSATSATNLNPKIHSFRVVTAHDAASLSLNKAANPFKIHKPILMCFICKLSFGNTKSFSLHANSEHTLNLKDSENQLLSREYSSAIIQRNVDEKPQISFLEPLNMQLMQDRWQQQSSHQQRRETSPTSARSASADAESKSNMDAAETVTGASTESNVDRVGMSSNSTNQKPNNAAQTTQPLNEQQYLPPSIELISRSDDATTPVNISPVSSSNSINTIINLSSLKTTTTTATLKTAAPTETTVAKTTATTRVTPSFAEAVTTSYLINRSNSSIDNLSSTYIAKHDTPTPTSALSPAARQSSSSSAHSPQSSAKLQATSSVVEYLQQQLQQHMENLTSPPSVTTAQEAEFAVSLCSRSGAGGGENTLSANAMMKQNQLFPPPASPSHLTSPSTFHASLVNALVSDQNSVNNSVKIVNEFLRHQMQQQQVYGTSQFGCSEHKESKGVDCKMCEIVEISQLKSPPNAPLSPNTSSSSMLTTLPPATSTTTMTTPTATTIASFTIGACPEHINGRPLDMDCSRCEMLLNSVRLNSGVQMSTRNSCKTLKCPQCNWHYKYQETLEIHMREKHPDGESACGYCLSGQQHPRLARGESYTCGYKPYRCEICNYSTTTKGNLSIHMQSDKHLNNMQELNSTQNIASASVAAAIGNQNETSSKILLSKNLTTQSPQQQQHPHQQIQSSPVAGSSSSTASISNKTKPSFKCDVCSYETSVARNLRIHMTSEKHTHNIAVLQNNIKHLQAFSFLQQQQQAAQNQPLNPLAATVIPAALGGSFLTETAIADLAYNQALMIQLLHQNSSAGVLNAGPGATMTPQQQQKQLLHLSKTENFPESPASPSTTSTAGPSCSHPSLYSPDRSPNSLLNTSEPSHEQPQVALDPSIEPDTQPTTLYSCVVCAAFNTNSLDELNQHLSIDRSRQNSLAANSSSDIMLNYNNNYICRLCNYKTNLKANFQLHSKTDKHLQKLSYINHIREGGPRNEFKLKYHHISHNTVQIKCNCCDFYTNSIQKLSLHTQHMRHDTMKIIFQHLLYLIQKNNASDSHEDVGEFGAIPKLLNAERNSSHSNILLCQPCNFSALNILEMVQHVKSIRHIQVEQFIGMQRRSEGLETLDLTDIFKICDNKANVVTSKVDFIKSERVSPDFASYAANATCNLPRDTSTSDHPAKRLDNYLPLPVDGKNTSSSGVNATGATGSWPSIIFKCNHGDFFSRFKQEMEQHIELMHPSEELDYTIIPANAVAIQAFQEAIAAATGGACEANRDKSLDMTQNTTATSNTDDCTNVVKRERGKMLSEDEEDEDNVGVANMSALFEMNRSASIATGGTADQPKLEKVQCPLCQDSFLEKNTLELHLMEVHSVSPNGMARLLQLVDNSSWQMQLLTPNNISNAEALTEGSPQTVTPQVAHLRTPKPDMSLMETITGETEIQCHQCGVTFKLQQHLLMHAQESQHYPMQTGEYQCLARKQCSLLFSTSNAMITHFQDMHMNSVISERHVYKYRCKQCSLAFKTPEKLATHTLYHTMRDATKCDLCPRNFRSLQSLQKHMEQVHLHSSNQKRLTKAAEPSSSSTYGENANDSITQTADISRDNKTDIANNSDIKEQPEANTQPDNLQAEQRVFSPVSSGKASEDLHECIPLASNPNPSNIATTSSIAAASSHQQQHFAAISALLKQKHQLTEHQSTEDDNYFPPEHIPQQIGIEAGLLAQHQSANHFSNLTPENLQSLQNLQSLRHLPQIAAAVAASAAGPSMNPVDMLNLMQFHQLMSLNFMNLAPPLVFGGAPTASSTSLGGNILNTSISNTSGTAATAIKCGPAEVTPNESHLQQQISPTAANVITAVSQSSNSQKRARTRITDDQLKILRAHFDINNSPSEESIMEMSKKANLPMKVVKHWFRNTLFKERQRNKDSPYNFNNPPSTTLNFEEYERTGQAKVTSLGVVNCGAGTKTSFSSKSDNGMQQNPPTSVLEHSLTSPANLSSNTDELRSIQGAHLSFPQQQQQLESIQHKSGEGSGPLASSVASDSHPFDVQIKSEPRDEASDTNNIQQEEQQLFIPSNETLMKQHHQFSKNTAAAAAPNEHMNEKNEHTAAAAAAAAVHHNHQQQALTFYSSYETKSESGSSEIHSRPQTPNSCSAMNPYSGMSEMLGQQLDRDMPLNNMSNMNNMGPPKKLQINKVFEKNSPSQFETNSNSSNSSSTSSGKRANRTRFTDYQIKVLQEFFENNSYPKDSDLEYLSKLLLLSPRVIVVWFQNARQKQRKIYENQPNNNSFNETEEKKQNINYTCKKCNLVFQRYYELIRHQKNHCFKEENNKKSAKAQIAAAQIAQSLSSEDSNSSMDINNASTTNLLTGHHHHQHQHQHLAAATALVTGTGTPGLSPSPSLNVFATSPQNLFGKASSTTDCSPSTTPTPPQRDSHPRRSSIDFLQQQKYECEKCSCTFQRYELFREHQLIHIMNPNLFSQPTQHLPMLPAATYSPFGNILHSLQHVSSTPTAKENLQQLKKHESSIDLSRTLRKRKLSEASDANEDSNSPSFKAAEHDAIQESKKSKRDHYGFLYQYFLQNESNAELKHEFQAKPQSNIDLEYLANFYKQTEMKKRDNYDFLFQYYLRNDEPFKQQIAYDATDKQNMNFLLQYYQLNESKKFFQLEASPNRTHNSNRESFMGVNDYAKSIDIGRKNIIDDVGSSNESNDDYETGNHENEISNRSSVCDTAKTTDLPQHNNTSSCQNVNTKNYESLDTNSVVGTGQYSQSYENENRTKEADNKWQEQTQGDVNRTSKGDKNLETGEQITMLSPKDTDTSCQPASQQPYKNLEDFLDATMIENHPQTLNFSDILPDITSTAINQSSTTSATTSISTAITTTADHRQNKRLRTTILPEQLNFLYECYQNESNPSRKMLEEISKKVNLKKRVVQVWFQNARAKDKKSRHQRYVSDDSNCDDKTRDSILLQGGNRALEMRDCQLCKLKQVNTHQHVFTPEHIGRVKALLEQTRMVKSSLSMYTNDVMSLSYADSSDTSETHQQQQQQQKEKLSENFADANGDTSSATVGIATGVDASVHQETAVVADILGQQQLKSEVSNQLSDLLEVNNGIRQVNNYQQHVDSDVRNVLENNLLLKINADRSLDVDVATERATENILHKLFNCNQMSGMDT